MTRRTPPRLRLRELLEGDDIIVCPGVTSPLVAKLVERSGFAATYTTGAGIANTLLGEPDIGLASMTELLDVNRRVAQAVGIPVIADIDTGYGGIVNVQRTVREFEDAGVAALQLEDQINPKRCGHFAGKQVVSRQEMAERIVAAVEARRDPDLLLVARTDARQVEGFDGALDRARLFVECGADLIFVEAPESDDELRAIPKELPVPVVVNMVEGGSTPAHSAPEFAEMGYAIVLFANALLRMSVAAMLRTLDVLKRDGGTAGLMDEMLAWNLRQEIVGLAGWQEREQAVMEKAGKVLPAHEEMEQR
jgi:2-methylisocitrate lyase-like PEP mutase family enzyme